MEPVYLNTAACGLVHPDTLQPVNAFYQAMQTNPSTATETFKFGGGYQRVHNIVAEFISAPAENIALLPNFSFGINTIVQSLKGDERVMLYRHDFPSLLEPFKINGFAITWIDTEDGFTIDAGKLKEALLRERISILAISEVQWLSGFVLDIGEMSAFCKQHNISFIVDATQSLGAVETDIRNTDPDVYIASNYKWMNAGVGTGIMYISDRFLEKYPPVIVGFNSFTPTAEGGFSYLPSAKNYEPGHMNIGGLLLLEGAINQKQQIGQQTIAAHNRRLTEQLIDGIRSLPVDLIGPADMRNRSAIVLLKDQGGLHEYLTTNNIIISKREQYLRISMHFHNTGADVAHAVEAISAFFR